MPHDSSTVNFMKNFAMSTIQSVSSITTIPPEPMIEPILAREIKSTFVSKSSSGIQPPDGPPVWTAFTFLLSGIPPPISKTISLIVMPIGTSTSPALFTLPTNAKTFVPGESSVPIDLNQSAPLLIIAAIFANVSTLLSTVGFLNKPFSVVLKTFAWGIPLLPSIDWISAVPSPHTNAPAPNLIFKSKLKSEPNMLSPKRLYFFASSIAFFKAATAFGYSALM